MRRLALLILCAFTCLSLRAQSPGETVMHTIQPGETFQSLATQHGTTVERIKELNPKVGNHPFAGTKILLPVTVQKEEPQQDSPEPTKSEEPRTTQELVLHYESREHANASTLRNSQGTALNGRRIQTLLVSGDDIHIIDSTLHLHTVLLPDQGIAYLYSDVLRQGIRFDYEYYVNLYMSSLAPASDAEQNAYQVKPTGETHQDAGLECTAYSGKVLDLTQTSQVDIWITLRYAAPASLRYFIDGLPLDGIPVRYVIERGGASSLAVKRGSVAAHLTGIEIRPIATDELLPDSAVRMSVFVQPQQYTAFLSNHLKALQKAGIYPTDAAIETDQRYLIDEHWNF